MLKSNIPDNKSDFIEKTRFYMRMLTGAFALLSAVDPADLSKDDLYDFCFGLVQMNEDFTDRLIHYMEESRQSAEDSVNKHL